MYSPCNIKYDSIALKYLYFRTFLNGTRVLQDLLVHYYYVDLQLLSLISSIFHSREFFYDMMMIMTVTEPFRKIVRCA
jgi:hypothetical protein